MSPWHWFNLRSGMLGGGGPGRNHIGRSRVKISVGLLSLLE